MWDNVDMFGTGEKSDISDQLPVAVHVVRSAGAFASAQKLWGVNARTVYQDQASGKEVLHFELLNPKTIIWLQRDNGRTDEFEVVMAWKDNAALIAEVFVLLPGPEPAGDDGFLKQVFGALLANPATVPFVGNKVE